MIARQVLSTVRTARLHGIWLLLPFKRPHQWHTAANCWPQEDGLVGEGRTYLTGQDGRIFKAGAGERTAHARWVLIGIEVL